MLDVGHHGMVDNGWHSGWHRVKSGDGLVPPGVVDGVRCRVVCGSVCCSRSCPPSHLPWLAALFSVQRHRALPQRRRVPLCGGVCRVMGGCVLGYFLTPTSRLVPGASRCVVSLIWLSHYQRLNFSPRLASQRRHAGTYYRGHSLQRADPVRFVLPNRASRCGPMGRPIKNWVHM